MTSNYNKVKSEGVEFFENNFRGKQHFDIPKIIDWLPTFADKVKDSLVEEILEGVGEDEIVIGKIDKGYLTDTQKKKIGRNEEKARIREFIKTLTK